MCNLSNAFQGVEPLRLPIHIEQEITRLSIRFCKSNN